MNSQAGAGVLIVGAGPTGLMMACQLALQGIPFRIIDKAEDHTTQSRALVIQARSLEIFDQIGLADRALAQGKIAGAIGAFFNGRKVLHVTVNNMGEGLTKFPSLLMLEQSRTEKILIDFLSELGHQVERRTALESFAPHMGGITSVLKLPSGQEESVVTQFVIGADGAHSKVREQSGIPFSGKTYRSSLFVLDCKAEMSLPADEMYLAFAGRGFSGFFPLTNGRWRILGDIPTELEGKENITFENIEKDFARRIRMHVKLYDPRWLAIYHSHHRHAATFRKGRCFLIGDAAHIHSPVGGQGMNTGLQDAYNLAWKLTLVLKGKGREPLLDTYTSERLRVAKDLVRSTDRVFNVVTSASLATTAFRKYIIPWVLKLVVGPVFEHLKPVRQLAFKRVSEIGISYRESILSKNASLGTFPRHAPRPGDRLPFIRFKDQKNASTNIQDKVAGTFFCLLVFFDRPPEEITSALEPFQSLCSLVTIPLTAGTKILYREFGIKEKGCYLIRPDRYIAYRSSTEFDTKHFKQYLSEFLNSKPS